MNILATKKAPPLALPLRYLLAGMLSFVGVQITLFLWPDKILAGPLLRPETVATVHLIALGWGSMIVVGVLYQMIPVLLQVDLHREDISRFLFWPTFLGVSSLIIGFRFWNTSLIAFGGGLTFLSFIAYGWNLKGTLLAVQRWSRQAVAMVSALGFFMFTVFWGFLMTLTLRFGLFGQAITGFLASHVVLGIVGWFSLMIFGVAYRLIPMFALSHGYPEHRQGPALVLLGSGVTVSVAAALLGNRLIGWLGTAIVLVAFVLFALDVVGILKHRRRKRLELVTKFSIASVAAGLIALLLAVFHLLFGSAVRLDPERLLRAVGYLVFMGWISFMIIGHLYKIIPFLAWLHRYGDKAGKEAVPLLRELYDKRVADASLWLLVTGTFGAFLGVLMGWGVLLRLFLLANVVGAMAFAYCVRQMFQPREAEGVGHLTK